MIKISKICCIGAGYVGGPTMAVIAQKNPHIEITVVDKDEIKISKWNSNNLNDLPVYEPGLSEVIKETRNNNLFFSTKIDEAIIKSEMIFISVNTPTKENGEGKGKAADLKYIVSCAQDILRVSQNNKIVVEKSTVPIKTASKLKKILNENNKNIKFEILSNPEFLAEGSAMRNLLIPDRVLIGGDIKTNSGKRAIDLLRNIYESWIPSENILTTNVWSSELSKLASNAFLAQRISSINSLCSLCEETGANILEVSKAIGMDTRIGDKFLEPSVGFGGSCFKKDILNLVYISESLGLNEVAEYWNQILKMNEFQKNRFAKKIIDKLSKTEVKNNKLTILGWAFKKNTNDSRESASIGISSLFLNNNFELNIYDPKVKEEKILKDIKIENDESFSNRINIKDSCIEAIEKSNCLVILTEWEEFRKLDWSMVYSLMNKPAYIFDGRNLLKDFDLNKIGFEYYSIGINL